MCLEHWQIPGSGYIVYTYIQEFVCFIAQDSYNYHYLASPVSNWLLAPSQPCRSYQGDSKFRLAEVENSLAACQASEYENPLECKKKKSLDFSLENFVKNMICPFHTHNHTLTTVYLLQCQQFFQCVINCKIVFHSIHCPHNKHLEPFCWFSSTVACQEHW